MEKRRKNIFVLVIPRFEDNYHAYYAGEIIKGVSIGASRLKIDILVHIVDRGNHAAWLDEGLLDPRFTDGIIFADIDNDLRVVKRVLKAGVPCMTLNNLLGDPINWIAIDNEKITNQVIDYLVGLGHKNIATIAGDLSTQAGLLRLRGYKHALHRHGLTVHRSYITEGEFLRTPARQAAEELLKLEDPPTAVFAASDVMAMELIDVAKKKGISIPDQLSVVGFDDNPLNRHSPVSLTSVTQPLLEMGRLGIENLYRVINGKAALPVKVILPAKIIKRGSTISIK